jgi:hypothetical protein
MFSGVSERREPVAASSTPGQLPQRPSIDEHLAPGRLVGGDLRGARAALGVLRRMPASMALAVVIPTGERLNEMMESLGQGVAAGDNPAFHETQQQWRELGKHLGWTERQTNEALGGGASLLLIAPHPADEPRAGSVRETDPLVWASISEISEATERQLRQKLETIPRTLINGRPVLTIESGALLMMVVPKGEAIGDPARPSWLVLTQARPMGTLLSLSAPVGAIAPRANQPAARANENEGGERILRAVANALIEPRKAAGDDRVGDSPFLQGAVPEEMGWATVFVRFDDWRHAAQFTITPSRGEREGDEGVTQLHVRAGSPELSRLLAGVPLTHDRTFDELHRLRGVLVIESAEPMVKPGADQAIPAEATAIGAVTSQSWREHLGAHAGAVSVLCARPVEDFTRADGEPTWRLFLSQQIRKAPRDSNAQNADDDVSPALLDRVALKAMSIVETGRLRGGVRFGLANQNQNESTPPPSFDTVPVDVQRISSAVPAPASWYLRLFTPRAWFAWRLDRLARRDDGCAGVLNMTFCGEMPADARSPVLTGATGARSDAGEHAAKAQDDAAAALEAWSASVQEALKPVGPSRKWISRGFFEPGFFRTAVPMIFSPVFPTGPVLDHLAWVRWDVWADDAGELRGVVRVKSKPPQRPAPAKPE